MCYVSLRLTISISRCLSLQQRGCEPQSLPTGCKRKYRTIPSIVAFVGMWKLSVDSHVLTRVLRATSSELDILDTLDIIDRGRWLVVNDGSERTEEWVDSGEEGSSERVWPGKETASLSSRFKGGSCGQPSGIEDSLLLGKPGRSIGRLNARGG
jgi:hypothetical protein